MESKLNIKAIETYAETYSAKLLNELFARNEKITGDEILHLPVNQAGFLILDNIYQAWALEADRLKSVYFDYEADEVKAGMKKLMNTLSKNISITRDNFEPLLSSAVKDTLLLILSPYSYYANLLNQEGISLEILKQKEKFIKINGGVFQGIIKALNNSPDLLNDASALLDEVFGAIDAEPEENDDVLATFAGLSPFSKDNFYEIEEEKPVLLAPEADDDEEEHESTLNDSFIGSSYETVADTLKSNQTSGSLKSMLSINQKFMFINDLFDGNQDDFTKVLDFLEACETKETAVKFVRSNYLKHNIWKENAPPVREFMALLDKKFDQ